jgi:uncharacterized protein YceH (UPF0502 family)
MHLFSGEVDEAALASNDVPQDNDDLRERVAELERDMAEIKQVLARLTGED